MAEDSSDDDLAHLLGVPSEALVVALGGGWRTEAPPDEEWFVQGHPAQVAVERVGGEFFLARPAPRWFGVADLVWHFEDRRAFDPADVLDNPPKLRQTADEIAARRRRTFRWCGTCRELHAPESFLRDEGYCMNCAAKHNGHVF
jgi:hypothetical protein